MCSSKFCGLLLACHSQPYGASDSRVIMLLALRGLQVRGQLRRRLTQLYLNILDCMCEILCERLHTSMISFYYLKLVDLNAVRF